MSNKDHFKSFFIFALMITLVSITTGTNAEAALKIYSPVNNKVFHKGGIGDCEGCHLIHGPEEAWENKSSVNNAHKLKGTDPGSTCLNCHQSSIDDCASEQHHVSTASARMPQGSPPRQLTPGGDFGWLKKDYSWGRNERSQGERHGHNIVAADFNYTSDSTLMNSPGGSYPSSGLSCISCHDPHGNYRRLMDGSITDEGTPVVASGSYSESPEPGLAGAVGSYRLLAGKNYNPRNISGAKPFTADPPAAVAPEYFNRAESASDTRVAYGSDMSEWCGNCHAGIHGDGTQGARRHPAGNAAKLSAETVTNYNSYIASGNLNGNTSTAFTSMVPFEMGTNDYGRMKTVANSTGSDRGGPTMEANVMCLTCHRAHASGWDSMTRWNMHSEFIVYNGRYPGVDNGAPEGVAQGRTAVEIQKTFYDRPARSFAYYQRSLCNKCHAKD